MQESNASKVGGEKMIKASLSADEFVSLAARMMADEKT